ncbi:SMR family transporter [Georgenia halophila]|uniref:SMR family transporter n=2 Tax=Georgenia halophila TaxID=620889 RepID=A0ABP8LKW5_9MICO
MALRGAVDDPGWIPVVVAGYLASFTLLGLTLRERLPIGVAYGIWGATGVALTALLGTLLFDEVLSPTAIAGIALIVVGVVLVESGSHRAQLADHGARRLEGETT